MRRTALLALLLAAGCLRARGTPEEPVILSLGFKGVKAVSEGELREGLATQGSDRFAWGDAWRFDPDAMAVDRRRIEAFYRQRGYYRATVEDVELLPEGNGRVRVVIHVREGEPVRVTQVLVEGLDAAPEALAKAGKLGLKPGQIFTEAAYDGARSQLQAALASTGYAQATVTQAAKVLPEDGTAEVTYRVVAGERFRFGTITVTGTAEVPRDKVEVQAAREAKPGEWFDERRLDRIQSRIFALGVFSGVRVNRGEPDLLLRTVPVVATVREAPFHTLKLGPGIGFEATRWEVHGIGTWVHRNWLGGLRRLQLDVRAGYAWIPDLIAPVREGTVGKIAGEFSQPNVFRDAVDFTVRVELEKSLEQSYGSNEVKLRIGTPFRPAPRWTLVPTYNLELYQLTDLVGTPGPDLPQVQNCPNEFCVLSYLEQRIIWDGRDHPLLSTEGLYVSLAVQEGFTVGGKGYKYLGFIPEARLFRTIRRGSVLAARARIGAIVPISETGPAPVPALFMAGGANSMRGYGVERLSPMSYQDGTWIPTGGNGLLEGSVEVRQDLGDSLIGALFLDGGNVSDASGSPTEYRTALKLTKLQLALGVGIRYRTPVGPFRADLGCRLPTDWRAGVPFDERFPPVPGDSGHREPIASLHLSLGEAF